MRQRWLAMLVVGGLLGLGCGKTVYRSHEAQFCSTNQDDDPFYECSPSSDLVCIQTYSEIVQATRDGGPRSVPIHLCRLACEPNSTDRCPNGEICCPGPISGRNYGKTGGCVPETRCDNIQVPDGGFDMRVDRPTSIDRPADLTSDSPPSDVPDAGPDLPVDAAEPDAATD